MLSSAIGPYRQLINILICDFTTKVVDYAELWNAETSLAFTE